MGAPQIVGPAFIPYSGGLQFFGTQNGNGWLFQVNFATIYLMQQKIGSGGANINGTGMWTSADGTTYAEADSAHAPNSALGSLVYDPAGSQAICGFVTDTFPQSQQHIFLKNFSVVSNTWGANYATGGPLAQTVLQHVFKRLDGTIFVIFDLGNGNAPVGQTRLQGAFWNGAAWSANIDLGAGSFATDGANALASSCCAVMNPATGDIHITYTNATHYYYQKINANNSLGSFHAFGALNLNDNDFGNIIIQGGNLYLGGSDSTKTNNEIFVGTGLAAPVWSTITPPELAYPVGKLDFWPVIQTDGTNLYLLVTYFDPTFTFVRFQIWVSGNNGASGSWSLAPGNGSAPFFYDFGSSPLAPHTDTTFGIDAPIFQVSITPQFGTTMFALTGVRNSLVGSDQSYVVNAQIFAGAMPAQLPIVQMPEPIALPDPCCHHQLVRSYNDLSYGEEDLRFPDA